VTDESQTKREGGNQFGVDEARDTIEGTVGDPHAVESSGAAFGDELLTISRLGDNDVGNLAD
jgi:hypothetical protein